MLYRGRYISPAWPAACLMLYSAWLHTPPSHHPSKQSHHPNSGPSSSFYSPPFNLVINWGQRANNPSWLSPHPPARTARASERRRLAQLVQGREEPPQLAQDSPAQCLEATGRTTQLAQSGRQETTRPPMDACYAPLQTTTRRVLASTNGVVVFPLRSR